MSHKLQSQTISVIHLKLTGDCWPGYSFKIGVCSESVLIFSWQKCYISTCQYLTHWLNLFWRLCKRLISNWKRHRLGIRPTSVAEMQISTNAHAPLSLVICPRGRAGKRCGELLLKAPGSRDGGGMPCGTSVCPGGLSPGAAWGRPPAWPPCSRDQPSFSKSARPREGRRGEGRGTTSIDLIF